MQEVTDAHVWEDKSVKKEQIVDGLSTAFIDSRINSNLAYRPEFVSNDYKQGKKVLSSIEAELDRCDEFAISVAFITKGGITPLLMKLKELERKGVHGRILTTDYNCFTEPEAIELLAGLDNIDIRMFRVSGETGGFHTKGYIFRDEQVYRFIIGSSNMTLSAITKNKEWNTKFISTENGQMAKDIVAEFEAFWTDVHTQKYNDFIDEYRREFITRREIFRQQRQAMSEHVVDIESYKLKPNKMQVAFIDNLSRMIDEGIDRALLLSSTGTGKTYASAFAVRSMGYKKVLFVVHRNQIARQAMKSYRKVFGGSVKMGLLSGSLGRADYDADFLFATVQTLSKTENLTRFARDRFDCIIYDEAHHITADSYKRVMDYFTPSFTLGMTATPDKRDDYAEDRNIYEIFDHNIAYEIRLSQAMEEDLLCPFHYFGITDIETVCDEKKDGGSAGEYFRELTSDERVRHVINQAKYYGYSGERVKGLIFCSRIEEAEKLSEKFNEYGLRTKVLSGSDSEEMRMAAMERLVRNESKQEREESLECIANGVRLRENEPLDYILSVDIFNEGVDIVEINQIIMLRPTCSPIVFTQQLGRGLRKFEDKEYVVILDFIGNYKNNFMIPIALSGDRSYNKDNVRRYVLEGSRVIPGASSIHFDEISRKRIFNAIDNANFSDIKLIKESYFNLKNKLGRIPELMEFDRYGELDVLRIFDNSSLGSYYKFLVKYEKEYRVRLSSKQEKIVEFISKKIANGKRIHELSMLWVLLSGARPVIETWVSDMDELYDIEVNTNMFDNVVGVLTNEFPAGTGKKHMRIVCLFHQLEVNWWKLKAKGRHLVKDLNFTQAKWLK